MEEPGYFVGIDPSFTGTGVAVLAWDGSLVSTERLSFPLAKYENEAARLIDVYGQVGTALSDLPLVLGACVEGYAMGAKVGREKAGEIRSQVLAALWDSAVIFPDFPSPQAVKKYACGSGKSQTKDQVMLAVYKKWGVEFGDNNITDAYVLARIAHDLYYLRRDDRQPEHSYEREVLDKLKGGV